MRSVQWVLRATSLTLSRILKPYLSCTAVGKSRWCCSKQKTRAIEPAVPDVGKSFSNRQSPNWTVLTPAPTRYHGKTQSSGTSVIIMSDSSYSNTNSLSWENIVQRYISSNYVRQDLLQQQITEGRQRVLIPATEYCRGTTLTPATNHWSETTLTPATTTKIAARQRLLKQHIFMRQDLLQQQTTEARQLWLQQQTTEARQPWLRQQTTERDNSDYSNKPLSKTTLTTATNHSSETKLTPAAPFTAAANHSLGSKCLTWDESFSDRKSLTWDQSFSSKKNHTQGTNFPPIKKIRWDKSYSRQQITHVGKIVLQ